MSYSKTSIIQLRESDQQDRTDENENGDYEILINPPLELSDSDEVSLKSAFIDSVDSSSGKIIITEDEGQAFSMSFYHYILNNDVDNKVFNLGQPPQVQDPSTGVISSSTIGASQPDGKHYFLSTSGTSGIVIRKELTGITFYQASDYGVKFWGDIHLSFNYTPEYQDTKLPQAVLNVKIPNVKGERNSYTDISCSGTKFNSAFPFEMIVTEHNKKAIKFSDVNPTKIDFNSVVNPASTPTSVLTPREFTIKFTLPAGSYDPDEISRQITDEITKLNRGSVPLSNYSMDSPLLTTNQQAKTTFSKPEIYYSGEDGLNFYNYNAGEFLSGTSNLGLEFKQGLNKFVISIMNIPLYDSGGSGQVSITSRQIGNSGNYFIANKNAGIVFSDLQPPSVWFKKFGFSSDILIKPNYTYHPLIGTITDVEIPRFSGEGFQMITKPYNPPILEGVNTTGSFRGLDVVVNKTNQGGGDPNGQQMLSISDINASTLVQNQIYSENSLQQQKYTYGYYMIEVDFGISQYLTGKNTYTNKIQSIISRFYSNDSYTSAYSEGSIPYIHRGQTIKLNKFKVRILKDTGDLADDIGSNNTIFMELNKVVKTPQIKALPVPLIEYEALEKEEK